MILGQETLGFRRVGFSPTLSLLTPAFSLLNAPQLLTRLLHRIENALLPLSKTASSFGSLLQPRYIYGAEELDQ